MEEPAVVSHPTGDAGGLPNPPPSHGGSDHTNTPRGHASSTASTARMAYLRQRFQGKKNSEGATCRAVVCIMETEFFKIL